MTQVVAHDVKTTADDSSPSNPGLPEAPTAASPSPTPGQDQPDPKASKGNRDGDARIRQLVEEKNSLQSQVDARDQQLQAMSQHLQTLAQHQQALQQQMQQHQNSQPAPPNPELESMRRDLIEAFGGGETGEKGLAQLEKSFKLFAAQHQPPTPDLSNFATKDDVVNMVGPYQSSMLIANEVSNLINRGMLSAEDVKKVQNGAAQVLGANPRLAQTIGVPAIVNNVWAEQVKAGQIRMGHSGGSSPLQPGGHHQAAPADPNEQINQTIRARFPSLASVSDKDLNQYAGHITNPRSRGPE